MSYVKTNCYIAVFTTSRNSVKELAKAVEQAMLQPVPGKYSSLLLDSPSILTKETEENIAKNCLTWAMDHIHAHTTYRIALQRGGWPSVTVQALPQYRTMNYHTINEDLGILGLAEETQSESWPVPHAPQMCFPI